MGALLHSAQQTGGVRQLTLLIVSFSYKQERNVCISRQGEVVPLFQAQVGNPQVWMIH
jgi:hypothetical protein